MERVGRLIIRTHAVDSKGNPLTFDEKFFAHSCSEKQLLNKLHQMADELLGEDDELVLLEVLPKQYPLKVAARMCIYKLYRG